MSYGGTFSSLNWLIFIFVFFERSFRLLLLKLSQIWFKNYNSTLSICDSTIFNTWKLYNREGVGDYSFVWFSLHQDGLFTYSHRNKFSRFSMPLALSRGILLRPRSEGSTVLGLGLYLHSWVSEHVVLVNNIPVYVSFQTKYVLRKSRLNTFIYAP